MDNQPPRILYYTTLEFEDGLFETPHFFVFDAIPEAAAILREYFKSQNRQPVNMIFKELIHEGNTVLPEDSYILTPTNDFGLEDDLKDPIEQQAVVDAAEEGESLMVVYPDPQDIDDLPCDAYFMGPFLPANSKEEFLGKLEADPFEISEPIDYVWLYRPSGESRSIKF